ncbi:MAG TPA: tRNA-dihydrouridine synthase family protein [Candidatus Mediterraneibacter caccogallinarum]|nr:tRNA-dihydrouridine synthase family protein [Candidatus Mediterraneibacter caccogallinarum]
MKVYLAPLEGITGWICRNAIKECFGGFDKYFVPFIKPNQKGHFSSREKKDVMPEHNIGMYTVPQILTNNVEDFLRTAEKLREYGYEEVNLNLGCPSRTVVTKGRGAGFLADPDRLDAFLDAVFSQCRLRISVKTRLGMENAEEFAELLEIYNKYPMEELIIHPRVQKDFYKNTPNLEAFAAAFENSRNPVCYNGDIFSVEDYQRFRERFPAAECIMTGRGVLADPALGRELKGGGRAEKEELRRYHDLLYAGYCEEMSGDRTILYKMKEMWSYMAPMFTNYKKYAKKIKKCEKCAVYEEVAEELFEKEELAGTGLQE